MKVLIAAFVLFSTSLAIASEVLVLDIFPWGFNYGVSSTFRVNKEMGRAWAEIEVIEEVNYSQSSRKHYQSKIEGLSYNEALQAIVYESEGKLTECATVRPGGRIFRGDRIHTTGNCTFKHRYVKVPYDDGYRTGITTKLHVYMIVK